MRVSLTNAQKVFLSICWLGVAIWVATVFYLSSRSSEELVADLPFVMQMHNKLLHFAAFFCGALPLVPALRLSFGWPWRKVCLVAIASISLYGFLDEIHQLWTPSRTGLSIGDWIADTLGAMAGAPLAAFIHAFLERSNHPAPAGN